MATDSRDDRRFGTGTNGLFTVAVIWFARSFWLGLIIALVGLIASGGFVRGRWN
jgi:hypothetical protein